MEIAQRYDALAARYDRTWRGYNRAVHSEILRHLPRDLSGARVLDVGCGTGEWIERLLRRHREIAYVVGIEPSRGMLNQSCARFAAFSCPTTVELRQCKMEEFDWDDASFQLVTSLNGLHYAENPRQWFETFHRVLDVGGTFVLQDYTHNGWPFFARAMRFFDRGTQGIYDAREVVRLAENAGFCVQFARTFRISRLWRGLVLVARKTAC